MFDFSQFQQWINQLQPYANQWSQAIYEPIRTRTQRANQSRAEAAGGVNPNAAYLQADVDIGQQQAGTAAQLMSGFMPYLIQYMMYERQKKDAYEREWRDMLRGERPMFGGYNINRGLPGGSGYGGTLGGYNPSAMMGGGGGGMGLGAKQGQGQQQSGSYSTYDNPYNAIDYMTGTSNQQQGNPWNWMETGNYWGYPSGGYQGV